MTRHLIAGLVLTLLGITLMIGGFASLLSSSGGSLTDQQIIERAKDLGMIELKDAIEGDN